MNTSHLKTLALGVALSIATTITPSYAQDSLTKESVDSIGTTRTRAAAQMFIARSPLKDLADSSMKQAMKTLDDKDLADAEQLDDLLNTCDRLVKQSFASCVFGSDDGFMSVLEQTLKLQTACSKLGAEANEAVGAFDLATDQILDSLISEDLGVLIPKVQNGQAGSSACTAACDSNETPSETETPTENTRH